MKCKNHATCKGQAQDGKQVCWECEKAERDEALYIGMVYIPKHEGEKHGGRAAKFPQNGKK